MTTAAVELLEGRRLLSVVVAAGPAVHPTLQSVRIVGPPGQATAIAVTFSDAMDPAGASDPRNYEVARRRWNRDRSTPASASYDDATRTVTLVPQRVPFDPATEVRRLTVHTGLVYGANGLSLDGDGDGDGLGNAVCTLRYFTGRRSLSYSDATRSRVRLRLTGPGRLSMVQMLESREVLVEDDGDDGWGPAPVGRLTRRTLSRGEAMQVWIEGATADTVLTGTVTARRRGGDADTSVVEIINPGGARVMLGEPAFRVGT